MSVYLTVRDRQPYHSLLADYEPGQRAMSALEAHNGNVETTVEDLWSQTQGPPELSRGRKLWDTLIKVLREELCGDEGLQAQFQTYTKNPSSAPLLTGLIVSLTTAAGLPIDPAISTIVVLYILKIGLNVFCEYTASS
ncbi:MAG: hypothetical protein JJU32_15045 [Phormidium sp. BM_Day4_Bin.17]|nr:hypothetical protein [Phormidium sp. BM_Day4_Bin.17]UCJ10488.1 MAG: hypothetical protein JWS08_11500 [Phormidium sp. PBR-2020]